MSRGIKADPVRVATIRAVVQSGGTVNEAARRLGMKPQHAWRLAKRLGLTRRAQDRIAGIKAYWLTRDPSLRTR